MVRLRHTDRPRAEPPHPLSGEPAMRMSGCGLRCLAYLRSETGLCSCALCTMWPVNAREATGGRLPSRAATRWPRAPETDTRGRRARRARAPVAVRGPLHTAAGETFWPPLGVPPTVRLDVWLTMKL
eukprot:4343171-Prymnesium_polylepis.1